MSMGNLYKVIPKELRELYRMSLSLKYELVATKNHSENQDTFPKFVADFQQRQADRRDVDLRAMGTKVIFALNQVL